MRSIAQDYLGDYPVCPVSPVISSAIGVDAAYNFVYFLIIDTAISECIQQVVNIKSKMMFGNTSSMVDMTERPASVSNRAVERSTEKFTLHAGNLNYLEFWN
jgi:hypothetical protein